MANLQTISYCDNGIVLNTTTTYTMIRLPQGVYTTAGFDQKGSLFYDTNQKSIVVIAADGSGYTVEMVNFTAL